MKSELIESERILKVLQSFNIPESANCYIESGPINIALGLSDTTPALYDSATIILPSFQRLAIIDSGKRVSFRLESTNNNCWHVLTKSQVISRLKLEGILN